LHLVYEVRRGRRVCVRCGGGLRGGRGGVGVCGRGFEMAGDEVDVGVGGGGGCGWRLSGGWGLGVWRVKFTVFWCWGGVAGGRGGGQGGVVGRCECGEGGVGRGFV